MSLKSIKRFSASSVLNIIGMAVAFATAYLILVQVHFDLSYNKGIKDADRVFLFEHRGNSHDSPTPLYVQNSSRPLCEAFFRDNPYVESYGVMNGGTQEGFIVITNQQGESYEHVSIGYSLYATSLEGFEVLGVEPLRGSFEAMKNDNSRNFALTESAARRIGLDVGDDFCLGTEWQPEQVHYVAAIIPDFPKNSEWHGMELFMHYGDHMIDEKSEWSFHYYAKLRSAEDAELCMEAGRASLRNYLANNYSAKELEWMGEIEQFVNDVRILSIAKSHLDPTHYTPENANRSTVYTLLAIAVLVIVIAFINFFNFFMAMVPRRLRSLNARRVYGCSLTEARLGVVLESVALVMISLVLAALLVVALQSSQIVGFISTSTRLADNGGLVLIIVGFALLMAVLFSLYPAHYITSFPLAMASKVGFASSRQGQRLRLTLVAVQFVISISLIICASFIKMQHDYMMQHDMGFNKEHLLSGVVPWQIIRSFEDREAFATALKENPQITDVAFANGPMVQDQRMGWGREIKGKNVSFQCYPVSYNFLDFMGIEMIEGSGFSISDELDTAGVYVFNEMLRDEYDLTLEDRVDGHDGKTRIAGFCKNFNFRPLQEESTAFAFYVFGKYPWSLPERLYIRTTPNANVKEVIDFVKDKVVELVPSYNRDDLNIDFFDKELGAQYYKEQKLATLITIFSLISILISLVGVFGLVLFETQYRRKEIGLRRVNGASIRDILLMFNRRYFSIVMVCFIIAVPLCYFIVTRYLSHFAYRMPLHWWVFALVLVLVLFITVLVVTLRSLRAATENPVNALKTDC